MPDSKRLKIQKALTAQLETITLANGYSHHLASSVVRGRLMLDANDMALVPLVSVLEDPKPGEIDYPDGGNAQVEKWRLLISGWTVPDPVNPTDAPHALMRDVKLCLSKIREDIQPHQEQTNTVWHLGGLIEDLAIGGGICRPPDNYSGDASYFLLPIVINFLENMENP